MTFRRGSRGAAVAILSAALALSGCRSVLRGSPGGAAYEMSVEASRALERARNLSRGGDSAGAALLLEPFLAERPEIVPVHRLYQDLLLRSGPRDALVERYRAAIENGETAHGLLLLARLLPDGAEADALLSRATDLAPDNAWVRYARGYREQTRGRLEAALAEYERALEADPGFPEALREAGETSYLLHDEETASERFERLVALDPEERGAVNALAAVLLERQEFVRAEEVLRAFLEVRPRDADAEIALSAVLVDSGQWDRAAVLLDELAARHPRNAIVAFNRAVVAEVHERDFAKALGLYQQYLDLGGEDTLRVTRWMEKIRAGEVDAPP